MSMSAQRAEIKNILSGVSGIGVVHERVRFSRKESVFKELFSSGGIINGWMITREATKTERVVSREEASTYQFMIRGYYGFNDDDASETTFQDLIETIRTEFRSNYKLNDTAENSGPIQVRKVDLREFGNTLCHHCELGLEADEIENI